MGRTRHTNTINIRPTLRPKVCNGNLHPCAGGFFPTLAVSAVVLGASFLFFGGADEAAVILLAATMRLVP